MYGKTHLLFHIYCRAQLPTWLLDPPAWHFSPQLGGLGRLLESMGGLLQPCQMVVRTTQWSGRHRIYYINSLKPIVRPSVCPLPDVHQIHLLGPTVPAKIGTLENAGRLLENFLVFSNVNLYFHVNAMFATLFYILQHLWNIHKTNYNISWNSLKRFHMRAQ